MQQYGQEETVYPLGNPHVNSFSAEKMFCLLKGTVSLTIEKTCMPNLYKMNLNISFLLIHMQHLFSSRPALKEPKFILLIQVIICSAPNLVPM